MILWGYQNGFIYAVKGNTYSIKDQLKEKGGKYGGALIGWYFDHPIEIPGYRVYRLDVNELIGYSLVNGKIYKKEQWQYGDYVNSIKLK